ncbi:MAG: protein kinase [Thermoanaerobaculia bacterium]|nr:protein kinase [Thermoanaerobaculia bacterium]
MSTQATLLVVDDNPDNRDFLSRRLTKRGFDVRSVDSGEAALSEVDRGGVDLVLLDIMMPVMDGLEVLRRLREDFDQAKLPVIMVTAKSEATDVVRALDLGANDYITKPIDFPVVLARVQKELRTSNAFRAASDGVATGSSSETHPIPASAPPPESESGSAEAPSPIEPPQGETLLGAGTVLAKRYQLGRRIGSGNFGTVYRGQHLELGLPVAVKVLQTRMGHDEESLARFRAEGRSACLIQHAHAVTVFDFGITDDGIAYMVMELLEGRSLAEELNARGRLGPDRLAHILPPVADVLEAAHAKRIVHRDIKPDNIFLHGKSDPPEVKVLDFGIAKLVGDRVSQQNLTAEGFILGTPAFMAPERLRNEPYDGRSDVYSLGVSLYQMMSGELPFKPSQGDPMAVLLMHLNDTPNSLSKVAPEVPSDLTRLVDRCLAKKPEQRPSLAEIAEAFAAFRTAPAESAVGPAQSAGSAREEISGELPTRRLDSNKISGSVAVDAAMTQEDDSALGARLRKVWRNLIGDPS